MLVVTTGSKSADLRHGSERLPGRRGRLARTTYLFTPISYAEFVRVSGEVFGADAPIAWLLSGGSPVALAELTRTGRLPEYVLETTRDWVLGEVLSEGRSRASLQAVMSVLLRRGGTPVGQALLAREAGLANNTVASGYVDQDMVSPEDLRGLGQVHAHSNGAGPAVRPRLVFVEIGSQCQEPSAVDEEEEREGPKKTRLLRPFIVRSCDSSDHGWRGRIEAGVRGPGTQFTGRRPSRPRRGWRRRCLLPR